MEDNNYTNDFEHFLRDNVDEFRMVPQRKVWYSIYNHMHPDRKWPSIAVCLLILVAILHIGISNNNDISKSVTASKSQTATLTKEQSPISLNQKDTQANSLASNKATFTKASDKLEPIAENLNYNSKATYSPNILIGNTKAINAKRAIANLNKVGKNNIEQTSKSLSQLTYKNAYKNNTLTLSSKQSNSITNNVEINPTIVNVNSSTILISQQNIETTTSSLKDIVTNNKNEEFSEKTIVLNPIDISQNKIDTENTNEEIKKLTPFIEENTVKKINESLVKDKVQIPIAKEKNSINYYLTPSIGFRNIVATRTNKASNPQGSNFAPASTAKPIDPFAGDGQALNLELGAVIEHMVNKNTRIKGGVQVNYTNYISKASELDHPIQNALAVGTRQNYLSSMVYSAKAGNININKSSLQISVPIGVDYKLLGTKNIKWYLGATAQPTFVVAGSAYLLSADNENYSNDKSFIRRFNLNTTIETFISIETGKNIVLNVGPQLRYQLLSSYKSTYNYKENLYNFGLKVGVSTKF